MEHRARALWALVPLLMRFYSAVCYSTQQIRYFDAISVLYHSIGAEEQELDLLKLKVIISDYLNVGVPLREYKTIRELHIEELNPEGLFQALVFTGSLQGQSFLQLHGKVDLTNLRVYVSSKRALSVAEYVAAVKLSEAQRLNGLLKIDNGSTGIPELLNYERDTQCERNDVGDYCERGTVVMDIWTNKTLAFQRQLDMDTPISGLQFLGTHNSFNNKADGYGTGDFVLGTILEAMSEGKWEFVWAQQWFTITDQLNMGVRHLMLDPVYFWDAMRLCHCGTSFPWFDKVIQFLEKALNTTIDFNSADLGCMPYDRPFEAAIQEIYDWITRPENENEFIFVLVNDEGPYSDWNHTDLIQKPILDIMGDLLFTPLNRTTYFGDSWPTPHQILKLGAKVMFTCSERCSDNMNIFADMTQPGWDHDTIKYFTPYPTCGGFGAEQWYAVGGESQVVGPIYNGPEEEGLVVTENFPYLLQCPVTFLQMDLASPGLINAAVWSWAPGYSVNSLSAVECAALDATFQGRWITVACNSSLHYTCVNITNPYGFTVSTSVGAWNRASCPSGFVFGLPTNGFKNWLLATEALSTGVSLVWINIANLYS